MSDAEREFAIREGERIGAWDAYSRARMGLGMIVHEASFCEGFDRGYLVRTCEVTALQAEIEALRKDAERFAWVLPIIDGECDKFADARTAALAGQFLNGKSGRDAIDAAIAKEKQQENLK